MATFISHSPEETAALGESWGREARAGWLIGLIGGLGAGKTLLATGIAHGLGIIDRVQSPTFQFVNEYLDGRLPLCHIDLYRLSTRHDVVAAGLEHYISRPAGVTVVEWIERWLDDKPPVMLAKFRFRRVEIAIGNENVRQFTYEDFGG